MTAASACLIAAAAAVSVCGHATWSSPPRYDGAGYAALARSLLEGQGYRAIDHPDRPRHAHFPPGYPILLAAIWRVTGVSAFAAHMGSVVCTVGATLAAWCWFRRLVPGPSAMMLGLALSVNWLWARTGGAIQSEPLYMMLGQLAILVASRAGRSASARWRGAEAGVLGLLLGACLLTRQVAVGLVVAVLLDLFLRRRWREALIVAAVVAVFLAPWLAWVAVVGPGARTQADMLLQGGGTWPERIAGQLVFYVRRIPDQITGPFVEVGTAFQHNKAVAIAANLWAVAATAIVALGWIRTLRRPRRRLAGLVALCTLLVLLAWPFTEAGRFLIPMIPCILVGAVEGLAGLVRRPRSSRRRLLAAALVLAASLPYSAYTLVTGKARATEASQRDFDEACAWLAAHAVRPGPVLTRHPGEVYWQTGRPALEVPTAERPGDVDADADTIARTIDTCRAAYLLIDQARYANAPPSPLARFVATFPGRVRKVWSRETSQAAVSIYEVLPGR